VGAEAMTDEHGLPAAARNGGQGAFARLAGPVPGPASGLLPPKCRGPIPRGTRSDGFRGRPGSVPPEQPIQLARRERRNDSCRSQRRHGGRHRRQPRLRAGHGRCLGQVRRAGGRRRPPPRRAGGTATRTRRCADLRDR
jgi:hypothetical protein